MTLPLMERRAVDLATVLLTRDPNVQLKTLTKGPTGFGVDIEVELLRRGQNVGRILGVDLKATRGTAGIAREHQNLFYLNDQLAKSFASVQRRLQRLPYPLLYMAFAMDSDRCFYGWILAPVVGTVPRQVRNATFETTNEWDEHTHQQLFAVVTKWYERLAVHSAPPLLNVRARR